MDRDPCGCMSALLNCKSNRILYPFIQTAYIVINLFDLTIWILIYKCIRPLSPGVRLFHLFSRLKGQRFATYFNSSLYTWLSNEDRITGIRASRYNRNSNVNLKCGSGVQEVFCLLRLINPMFCQPLSIYK